MAKVINKYKWAEGAKLDEHSKKKHKILKEYFTEYLKTRCILPQQEKFRLAIIDGFSGAGIYECGSYGSPLLFVQTLKDALNEINIGRTAQGLRLMDIECTFIFNDKNKPAMEQLKKNVAPLHAEINQNEKHLHIRFEYFSKKFDQVFPEIKRMLQTLKYGNVIFNLDQCGHSLVNPEVIREIMRSWGSAEVFLTFLIGPLLTYLSTNQDNDKVLAKMPDVQKKVFSLLSGDAGKLLSKEEYLGYAEKFVYDYLKACAPYVSPFSINNPDGWRYWFMHFANSPRARQVYNNVQHANSSLQAHFGRSGLHMLSYDPKHEGQLYLFDSSSRERAKKDLYDDIPRLISQHGDALTVEEFYSISYSETAAHSDDIHEMIIENPDVEVITPKNHERRKANTIKPTDILKIKDQKSMFPLFKKSKR